MASVVRFKPAIGVVVCFGKPSYRGGRTLALCASAATESIGSLSGHECRKRIVWHTAPAPVRHQVGSNCIQHLQQLVRVGDIQFHHSDCNLVRCDPIDYRHRVLSLVACIRYAVEATVGYRRVVC